MGSDINFNSFNLTECLKEESYDNISHNCSNLSIDMICEKLYSQDNAGDFEELIKQPVDKVTPCDTKKQLTECVSFERMSEALKNHDTSNPVSNLLIPEVKDYFETMSRAINEKYGIKGICKIPENMKDKNESNVNCKECVEDGEIDKD